MRCGLQECHGFRKPIKRSAESSEPQSSGWEVGSETNLGSRLRDELDGTAYIGSPARIALQQRARL